MTSDKNFLQEDDPYKYNAAPVFRKTDHKEYGLSPIDTHYENRSTYESDFPFQVGPHKTRKININTFKDPRSNNTEVEMLLHPLNSKDKRPVVFGKYSGNSDEHVSHHYNHEIPLEKFGISVQREHRFPLKSFNQSADSSKNNKKMETIENLINGKEISEAGLFSRITNKFLKPKVAPTNVSTKLTQAEQPKDLNPKPKLIKNKVVQQSLTPSELDPTRKAKSMELINQLNAVTGKSENEPIFSDPKKMLSFDYKNPMLQSPVHTVGTMMQNPAATDPNAQRDLLLRWKKKQNV